MPEFARKTETFLHKGMKWNVAVDKIGEGQLAFGKNIRSQNIGQISGRNGTTEFVDMGGSYVHSISRMNNDPTEPPFIAKTYIVGQDDGLNIGRTAAELNNAAINPVKATAAGVTNAFSGDPLSMVDAPPASGANMWKYIGDSKAMVAAGYYQGDTPGTTMGRALSVGLLPPAWQPTITVAVGDLNGNYQWRVAYRRVLTGARSNPSAATRDTLAVPALTLANQSATFTLPASPIDPQTGAADTHVVIDVYRFSNIVPQWKFVGFGTSGSSFTDSLPDSQIQSAETPPTVVDQTTGIARFSLAQPFVTQQGPSFGNASVSLAANGAFVLTWTSGIQHFGAGWLQGTFISVDNGAFTVYQALSANSVELAEDATGFLVPTTTYGWSTLAGTLVQGSPLPRLWGPYGIGVQGFVVFGVGDPLAPGTLYWTNGNDPDSSDQANSLVVTSPSEPLQNGCMFNGQAYVWSTERMFIIQPNMTIPGQFTVQEVAGKGLWFPWALTVQASEAEDVSISWVSKDGVYNWSSGGGARLSDDLGTFFPHDNEPGVNPAGGIFPWLVEPKVGAIDFGAAHGKFHRLTWFQGRLYYDYPTGTGGTTFNTLVYEARGVQGWESLDLIQNNNARSIMRYSEVNDNNLKIGFGQFILDETGGDDNGTAMQGRIVGRANDMGDPRAQKLYGDLLPDLNPNGSTVTVNVLGAYHTAVMATADFSGNIRGNYPPIDLGNSPAPAPLGMTRRIAPPASFSAGARGIVATSGRTAGNQPGSVSTAAPGLGALSQTIGLDISWTTSGAAYGPTLFQFTPTWVMKPEITQNRATDKTDDGWAGAKYLRGFVLENNTLGVARRFNVLVDGVIANPSPFALDTAGQLEVPFGMVPPAVGGEFQIQPDASDTSTVGWELFTIRWVWEKWPDAAQMYSAILNLQTNKPKYVRGFQLPVDTAGAAVQFKLSGDGTLITLSSPNTPAGAKTATQFSLTTPIVAHELQIQPQGPCRAWYDEIVWDAEEWPESTIEFYPFTDLGKRQVKYLRGFKVPIETGGAACRLYLRDDAGDSITFGAQTTTALIKSVFPFIPSAPLIAHEFQLRSLDAMRVWFSEAEWDFEIWPELSLELSAWLNAGSPGSKFMQGFIVPLDTNGAAVSLTITYTTSPLSTPQTVTVGPFTTPAGQKTPVPISFATPFICDEIQIAPSAVCRVWYEEIDWRWEPAPELVATWKTQETNHDIPGFHSMRDAYIAYIGNSASEQPSFTVTTKYGSQSYALPASNGVYTRQYVPMLPQKAAFRKYALTATSGVRLYRKDCSVGIVPWAGGGIQYSQPFGDESRAVGARI